MASHTHLGLVGVSLLCFSWWQLQLFFHHRTQILRGAAKARRTPEEVMEYQTMDERTQEIVRALKMRKTKAKLWKELQ